MAGLWVSGGFLFRLLEEEREPSEPEGGWPGVTILVPAYNEESVIPANVHAARAVDYPELEILVLDDGSTDETVEVAKAAAEDDARVEVIRDAVNRGKAERLNVGFARASHELVIATDADTHLHPLAVKLLVARIAHSPRIAAVAGAPHVTNRRTLLGAMQSLEAASIIGLTRRTQALGGHVRIVAGVLGIFRKPAVLGVGGFDGRMTTEDIELTWRLLIAGWLTSYEPNALAGMQVPSTLSSLWKQRRRWARGQGEALHEPLRHDPPPTLVADLDRPARNLSLAGVGGRPRGRADRRHARVPLRRSSDDLRLRPGMGNGHRPRLHAPARIRSGDRGAVRPSCAVRLSTRPALSPRLLGDLRDGRDARPASGLRARPPRATGRLGRSARTGLADLAGEQTGVEVASGVASRDLDPAQRLAAPRSR